MTIFSIIPGYDNYFDSNGQTNSKSIYSTSNCGCYPKTNIRKTGKKYFLDMSVAGLEKSDIKIKVEKDILEVLYENQSEKVLENNSDTYLRREFENKNFKRSFTLPEETDIDQISASVKNGILTIELPVKEEEKSKISHNIKVS
ncbi:MAG: Hsp20/alpha crystallin family protein [Bacteroidota bacterium]